MLQNMQASQEKLYQRGLQSPYALAQTYSLLGNGPEALRYLKIAYEKRDESMVQLETDAAFTSLHDEPAYKDLIEKLRFPTRK